MGSIGWPELIIILIVVLLLFGGTRLAGLGKASGKAIREFKEETRDLKKEDSAAAQQPQITAAPQQPAPQVQQPYVQPAPQPPQAYDPAQPQPQFPQNQQPPADQR